MVKFTIYKKIFALVIMYSFLISPASALIKDELVESTLKQQNLEKTVVKQQKERNASAEGEPVEISIPALLTTKSKPEEGSYINFVTASDVKYNGKNYPAGTPVKARIETVSQNSVWGVPADIVIGNFEMEDIPLNGEIKKTGANRILWVRPVSIVAGLLTGAGFFLIFLRGGHAKITPEEKFVVYLP